MNNQDFNLADAIDVIEEIVSSGGEFSMYPRGRSMLPLIVESRDCVVIKRDFEHTAKKHDIAFYRRDNGQFVLHRVMKCCDDGTFIMCGDNQTELEKGIRPDNIIAVVTQLHRKGKKVNFDGPVYSTYVFLWTVMPLRRLCKFVYRVLHIICRSIKGIFTKSAS